MLDAAIEVHEDSRRRIEGGAVSTSGRRGVTSERVGCHETIEKANE